MFIGGTPGSTAGGIKTTTAALQLLAIRAAILGRDEITIFERRIPHEAVYRAAAVTALGLVSLILAVVALELTQRVQPLEALFEAVSALGTVGLSLGATAKLDGVGKLLIMACMFAGRLGPLTLFLIFLGRRERPVWIRPEEDVVVG